VVFSLSFDTFAHSKFREEEIFRDFRNKNTKISVVSTKKSSAKKSPARVVAKPKAKAPVAKPAPKPAPKAVAKTAPAPKNAARPALKSPVKKSAPAKTTAASILGHPVAKPVIMARNGSGPVKVKAEWQKYYHTLIDLRERLVAQMNGLAKESAEELAGYSLHMADSGTDNFDRDFALSLLSSDQDAMYEIEEALKRIERNTFGVCELTGKAIPKARLEAIPWTRFTVEAQAQLERDGALRQRRLGALGSVDSAGSSDVDSGGGGDEEEHEEKVKEKE
jgi:DnaK suppressor protein